MNETPAEAWTRCSPWLQAALDQSGGAHTLDDVAAGVAQGRFQFWPGQRSATITEVLEAPRLNTLNLWLMGGDLRELRAVYPAIEAFARRAGCGRIIGCAVFGRRGWARALGVAGEPRWTIFARDLT